MSLPYFQTDDRQFSLMQTGWKSALEPVIDNPIVNGILIKNVELINGVTAVNHLLGRKMQGWFITDMNAAATVYRSSPLNNLTLKLTSNAAVIVNLYCF